MCEHGFPVAIRALIGENHGKIVQAHQPEYELLFGVGDVVAIRQERQRGIFSIFSCEGFAP